MIEHRCGDLVESFVDRADDEKVVHNRIEGGGLAKGPHNCGDVLAYQCRCLPGRGGAYGSEDGLLEDHRRQFWVRVGHGTAWIGEAYHLPENFGGSLHLPEKVNAIFVGVNPDPPGALYQGVYVS